MISAIIIIFIVLIVSIDWYISNQFEQFIYSDINQVPKRKIALVLGTSKYIQQSGETYYNAYYAYRVQAAAKLYQAGKIDGVLVSGDNSTQFYDEPSQMTQDLIKLGVPSQYITQDYAGFRTLDSIVRAKKVFGLENYTIVSQKFHCQRAIYIAQSKGQNPIAFSASNVQSFAGLKTRLREVLARFKAFLDCKILKINPKFLGKPETINYRN
ncbi:SanA/YdcF family protein [Crocosphaera chwakensis]|uniref:Putative SanA protein n=1 Tax=Crocosphaera chwakensis CCY0110 TaxID=391612 RepID=A3IN90_9CHRO|nr:ElyC/SanA/YdcF family protein [Crocosphaera chwakensis]EAZ92067.1 Putative SanA protein [Crocosphaera chwakensis CCY0110]